MSKPAAFNTLEQRIGLAVELLADAGYDGTQHIPVDGPYHEFFIEELLHEGILEGQARRALNTASHAIDSMLLEAERFTAQSEGEVR